MGDNGIFLLDTNIISNVIRVENGLAAQRGRQAGSQGRIKLIGISVVVYCELVFGLTKRPSARLQAALDAQLAALTIFPLDHQVVEHYARLRTHLETTGQPIGANDTLIAAHALALGATLVTADAEFARVPGLHVENWLADDTTPVQAA